jgi:site-specific DNA-adenine methylase
MAPNHFIISYHGNKKDDYHKFKKNINYEGINTIIEPFCGTSAISFNIWKEYGDKFTYHLNDLDGDLYNIYKLLKEENIDDIFDKINDVKKKITSKEDFNILFKNSNKTIYEIIYMHKASSYRFGFYHKRVLQKKLYKATSEQRLFLEFLKCDYVHITNLDYKPLYDHNKNDPTNLIILDPPYLESCNLGYAHKSTDCYHYLSEDIKNSQARVLLPLEQNNMVLNLFKEYYILVEWLKTYQMTKKQITMILISNY